jgi:hypothetical protein
VAHEAFTSEKLVFDLVTSQVVLTDVDFAFQEELLLHLYEIEQ